jgi:hypothetical protein
LLCSNQYAPESYRTCFNLHYKGECQVADESGALRTGTCSISGDTLSMNLGSTSPTFGYPEFREANVTLNITGDTLTTLAGRKFFKKGSPAEPPYVATTTTGNASNSPPQTSSTAPQTATPSRSSDEQALSEAKKVWHQYFTRCGDTYVAEETGRMTMHAMEPGDGNKISQFKGDFEVHTATLGEAERLNNIEYYAEIWFVYQAERTGSPGGAWTAWRGPGQMGHNNRMRDLGVMKTRGTWNATGDLMKFNKWRRVDCSVLPD